MKRIQGNSYLYEERLGDISDFQPSMTQQHFANEVDVNMIVERATRTGLLGDPLAMAARQASFGDFSDIGDYQSCVNKVTAANNAFNSLPADVRSRFNNNPAELIAFLSDDKNIIEASELGLVDKDNVKVIAARAAISAAEKAKWEAEKAKTAAVPPA